MYSQVLARAGSWAEALEPGPWPLGGSCALGPAPDLHDSRHASGIHNLFALDFPVPGLMSVAYRCLFCLGLVDQTNGKSPYACILDHFNDVLMFLSCFQGLTVLAEGPRTL